MKKTKFTLYIENLLKQEGTVSNSFIRLENDTYYNDLFGISFRIPKNWFVANKDQMFEAANNQNLVGEYEHYKEELDLYELPSFLATKYNPDSSDIYGLVSPTLNFNIIPKQPEFQGLSLKEYAELIDSTEGFGYHMLKKFQVTHRGNIYYRNGYDFIKYDTEYLFEHAEIDTGIMVELSILNIDYGDFFLDFSMTDCKHQNQVEIENFKMIERSISLIY
jgi:hypothetical protein